MPWRNTCKIPVCGGRTRRASLHAGCYSKRGGEGGEHGDDELNDFAPNGRFVSFHRVRLVSSEERGVRSEERGERREE